MGFAKRCATISEGSIMKLYSSLCGRYALLIDIHWFKPHALQYSSSLLYQVKLFSKKRALHVHNGRCRRIRKSGLQKQKRNESRQGLHNISEYLYSTITVVIRTRKNRTPIIPFAPRRRARVYLFIYFFFST